MSSGFCVTKYTPTPFERTRRTTSSMRSTSTLGASLNSRWASSKKNTSLGFSGSPISGNCSNSSDNIHSRKVAYRRGEFISLSAARMFTTPWPLVSVCMKSWMSSMGSPKNLSPPCCSICSRPRWMAPTLAALMLPYSVVNSLALSPTYWSMARRSFRSSSSRPLSSAILNTRLSPPNCVSLRLSMRPSSSGPMSDTVARTGWPCSPHTSHKVTGQACVVGCSSPRSLSTAAIFSGMWPVWLMPVRSPFTSAMNTGTPMREKFSAKVRSVTVLPVPVAPVIRPWRLARPGSRWHSMEACLAISRGSAISGFLGGMSAGKSKILAGRLNQYKGFPMAGHSKWANIQHRKGRQDEKRGKIWTRIIREITVAARTGGGDTTANPRLRLAIDKAQAANMPADRIKYNIDKASGNAEGVNYEEIRYEGYGIGGAAIIVDTMTDNRVRTVAEVRHAFSKHGGNLGTEGSVAFQFKHCGQLIFAPGTSEDQVMEVALEAGAEDVVTDDEGAIEVLTSPGDFEAVKNALEAAGLTPEMAEVTMRPENTIALAGEDAAKMQKLLDVLEDLDDVQNVFHNAEIDE